MIDIEGAEFSLIDKELFCKLIKSIIFIELHNWFFKDSAQKLQKLMSDAMFLLKISTLTTSSRDLSKFPELFDYRALKGGL